MLAGLVFASWIVVPTPAASQVNDNALVTFIGFDELEYASGDARPVRFDGNLWIGGDYNRGWLKLKGTADTRGAGSEMEGQVLLSRLLAPFWDVQIGLRVEVEDGSDRARTHLALGFQGLARYWFEVESFLFVSHEGDVSARLEAAYDLFLTQRLILEPQIEVGVGVQDVPEWGVGRGLSDIELSARLRYEAVREIAPYVGISWSRRTGSIASIPAQIEDSIEDTIIVGGIRWWW